MALAGIETDTIRQFVSDAGLPQHIRRAAIQFKSPGV
jgi:uncharacterized protein (UPF0147 family)